MRHHPRKKRRSRIVQFHKCLNAFGGWDKDATKYLKEISRLGARRWGKNDSIEIKQFFQRLSITLQRGNAALLVNRDADPTSV